MKGKQCVLCGEEIEFWELYYTLPFGNICSECGNKIIEHLKEIIND